MDMDLDGPGSLMRVTRFATAEDQEELIARGPVRMLIAHVLALPPAESTAVLLRAAGPGWSEEHDLDAIRELAARPDYTGAAGDDDTALRPEDTDRAFVRDETIAPHGPSGTPADPPAAGDDRSADGRPVGVA